MCGGNWGELQSKFVSSESSFKNIWHMLKIYSIVGQDFKNVISEFAFLMTAIVNVYLMEVTLGLRLLLHPHFSFL